MALSSKIRSSSWGLVVLLPSGAPGRCPSLLWPSGFLRLQLKAQACCDLGTLFRSVLSAWFSNVVER